MSKIRSDMTDGARGILREKRCAACGAAFDCFAGGCWCDDVPLTDAMRGSIQHEFAGCLCPVCLRERAPSPSTDTRRNKP